MTLGTISGEGGRTGAGYLCTCFATKMLPYFSENAVISQNTINQLISESFLTVKGAALFLPRGNGSTTPRISHRRNKHAGDLQQHLQAMFTLLRPEDNIRLAVRLESTFQSRTRYMVVVSTNGRQDTEESIVLGMDFCYRDSGTCTIGLVLPLWSDTLIHLDGDGGFSVSTDSRVHVFKPVSVQAMWSALQSLHKACEVSRTNNYYPGSLYLTWISYYESRVNSNQAYINEWNAMQDVQSHRSDSPLLFKDVPTERELTERQIKTKLREIMMQKDLENVTSKEIRTELEMQFLCNLREFKEFIDNEMIVILGQMDSPTQIFDHVYLGSEWNASNLEDLQNRGVRYILNVTREIDNFFPGVFEYHNIRVYDEEATDLLAYWNDTFKFISKAKKSGAKCLVHCKMGVSRSASTVIAYAMKEYGWNLEKAYSYVKEKRTVTKPNPSFMRQLEEYQGILLASKQRHNKLWRSHSDSDLSDHHEPICKTSMDFGKRDDISPGDQLDLDIQRAIFSSLTQAEPQAKRLGKPKEGTEAEIGTKDGSAFQPVKTSGAREKLTPIDFNGCPAECELDTQLSPDDCYSEETSEALLQPERPLEPLVPLPKLEVNDLENDALTAEANCTALPLERLDPMTGEPLVPSPLHSPNSQPDADISAPDSSVDRIDFFSAREKFLELSQEGRKRAYSHSRTEELSAVRNGTLKMFLPESLPSEQSDPQGSSSKEKTPPISDDSADEEQPKETSETIHMKSQLTRSQSENSVSVKEIITEIESINQGAGVCQQKSDVPHSQVQPPKRNTIHELPGDLDWVSENHKTGKLEVDREDIQAIEFDQPKGLIPLGLTGSPCPQSPVTGSDEDLQAHEPQENLSSKPQIKWCPGSVKRATKEFEERLRQEQETQLTSPSVTVPGRKNSKNDGGMATIELAPKGRTEELPYELSTTLKDNEEQTAAKNKSLEPVEKMPPTGTEVTAESQSASFELHPVQSSTESSSTEPEAGHPEMPVEHRTIHLFEDSEELAPQSHLPKTIEIIEYSHVIKPPGPSGGKCSSPVFEMNSEEDMLGKTKVEKSLKVLPCVDEASNAYVCSAECMGNPELLTLSESSDQTDEHRRDPKKATFTLGSPEEELNSLYSSVEATPFISHLMHLPPKNMEYPPHTVHLEGVTELCSETDDEPTERFTHKDNGSCELEENRKPHRENDSSSTQLSTEDLNLIDKISKNIRELHEVLDFSSLSYGLPYSCSSDSIKDLTSSSGMVKQRAKEIESRIRQAGLTTPSQMKRSASLAKLGCLELSTEDLSERESVTSETNQTFSEPLQSFTRCEHEERVECSLEDPSKKVCIVAISLPQEEPQPTMYLVEQLKTTECIVQSKPVEKPAVQYAKAFGLPLQSMDPKLTSSDDSLLQLHTPPLMAPDSPNPTPVLAVAPRQQRGRTHPLHKLKKLNEKKRTYNPLYNTM
ncbi:protein phosphatase Slingshot homolog 2 isoform X2 [Latimeria chalumnae]|uniref:protein-serine/threonine phosphatase n=1 Tax=Latimeria chalumnae TaxID=7897 RepID=H3B8E8_LATCH|nr:PREDICTED: protein phosphatase Slingshot homolog 2 [Latimeria chalumnae]|eukprot:XP_005997052.1 PREDICTED: protein phosphatase Slingshot homolog 2 [Latimeria chalumnae]